MVRDFTGFAKDEEAAKISRAVEEMVHNFNLGVGGDDLEELLEVALRN